MLLGRSWALVAQGRLLILRMVQDLDELEDMRLVFATQASVLGSQCRAVLLPRSALLLSSALSECHRYGNPDASPDSRTLHPTGLSFVQFSSTVSRFSCGEYLRRSSVVLLPMHSVLCLVWVANSSGQSSLQLTPNFELEQDTWLKHLLQWRQRTFCHRDVRLLTSV